MKTALLIIGIAVIVAAVLSALFAALNLSGYRNLMDGSSEQYARLHRRAIVFFVAGGVLAAAGIVCLIIRFRL